MARLRPSSLRPSGGLFLHQLHGACALAPPFLHPARRDEHIHSSSRPHVCILLAHARCPPSPAANCLLQVRETLTLAARLRRGEVDPAQARQCPFARPRCSGVVCRIPFTFPTGSLLSLVAASAHTSRKTRSAPSGPLRSRETRCGGASHSATSLGLVALIQSAW